MVHVTGKYLREDFLYSLTIKNDSFVLGIDDSPFRKNIDRTARLIGTLMRLGGRIDGFFIERIVVDGDNGTDAIISMWKKIRPQKLAAFLLDGVTLGGMNIVDIEKLYSETSVPVICVTKREPSIESMKEVVRKHFPDNNYKMRTLSELTVDTIELRNRRKLFCNLKGIDPIEARTILERQCTLNLIPDAVRISHLLGESVKFGSSKRR